MKIYPKHISDLLVEYHKKEDAWAKHNHASLEICGDSDRAKKALLTAIANWECERG